jgi:hypothetical protein
MQPHGAQQALAGDVNGSKPEFMVALLSAKPSATQMLAERAARNSTPEPMDRRLQQRIEQAKRLMTFYPSSVLPKGNPAGRTRQPAWFEG